MSTKKTYPTYVFRLVVKPDVHMGFDSVDKVKNAIEEAIRNEGLDNAMSVSIDWQRTLYETKS